MEKTCTAFVNDKLLASGHLPEVALKAKAALDGCDKAQVIIFDDATSARIEVDFQGSAEDVLARVVHEMPAQEAEPARGPGRPKLGVVAREVTLLPRHWDWLRSQPGGASVTLRKLVDAARHADPDQDAKHAARDRAYGFMTAMAGDAPGFEEATRALYRGDANGFTANTEQWTPDVRDHARALAQDAF